MGIVVPSAAGACACSAGAEVVGAAVFAGLFAGAFLAAECLVGVDVFFAEAFLAAFFAGGFFAGAFFAGIGMVMPGMCICAAAGAERVASARALVAANNIDFTNILQGEASPSSDASARWCFN